MRATKHKITRPLDADHLGAIRFRPITLRVSAESHRQVGSPLADVFHALMLDAEKGARHGQ